MPPPPDPFALDRADMVRAQFRARGLRDERVLAVFAEVPRHLFIPEPLRGQAYGDHPVPIALNQTISQPYMVALMLERLGLKGTERVLEIGTGSGYQTALLSRLCREVYSIERLAPLGEAARALLDGMGCANVRYRIGDGTLGWPEAAPFDRITVTAGAPYEPPSLLGQIAEGGRMVIPVGDQWAQQLLVIERRDGKLIRRTEGGCVFVKLIGREGWEGA
jgi:protein-L-isoaspartate(D-aspartate) O-methyltransferase